MEVVSHRHFPLAAFGVVALLVVAIASPAAAAPRRFAVVVGANVGADYNVRLRHAVRDAEKMHAVLVDLGGVAPEDARLLVAEPSAREILAALRAADRRAAAHGPDATVLFYYSGHADAKALLVNGTRLPVKTLSAVLRDGAAGLRLGFLDACHAGRAIASKGGKRRKVRLGLHGAPAARGYAILTSSSADEDSQESDELAGSFFTHHLVSGLRGAADADSDARVTLGEAYRYAYARTLRHTQAAPVAQHPRFASAFEGGQDVVLTSLEAPSARVRVGGDEAQATWVLFAPNTGRVVAEVQERPQTVVLAVPPGPLEVYRRSGQRVERGRIQVPEGGDVVLTRDALEAVPQTAWLRKGEAGVVLGVHVGLQGFVDGRMAREFVGPAPVLAVAFTVRDLGLWGLDLGVDLGLTSVRQEMTLPIASGEGRFQQRLTEVQLGLALSYRVDFGSFSLAAGPRIAYLYLDRTPDVPEVEAQSVHTVAVGAQAGFGWRFSQRVSVGLVGRGAWVPLPSGQTPSGASRDGPDRDQLLVELQAAASFHF